MNALNEMPETAEHLPTDLPGNAEVPTLSMMNEVGSSVTDYLQSCHQICADYMVARVAAGHEVAQHMQSQNGAKAKAQAGGEFIEHAMRANFDVSAQMFNAFNVLVNDMTELVVGRKK